MSVETRMPSAATEGTKNRASKQAHSTETIATTTGGSQLQSALHAVLNPSEEETEIWLALYPLVPRDHESASDRLEAMEAAGFDAAMFASPAARRAYQLAHDDPDRVDVMEAIHHSGLDEARALDISISISDDHLQRRVDRLRDAHSRRQWRAALHDAGAMDPDTGADYIATQSDRIRADQRAPDHGGRSLAHLVETPPREEDTILGERYLCRGGGLLFVGPSGIGKSSASVQQDLLWSIGREAFGIAPARPLRILCIQAENDDGDMHEMASGVVRDLQLTEDELAMVQRNTMYISHRETVGDEFIRFLSRAAYHYRPDLIRIDPLTAFLGADPTDVTATSQFLRSGLNPLLNRIGAAVVINHHTPKTNHRDTTGWSATDWMYAGAGAAELTNWARAVLVINPEKERADGFCFIAAKRGGRIGWRDDADQKTYQRWYGHAETGISWHQLDEPERDAPKPEVSLRDVCELVPMPGMIEKGELIQRARENLGIGKHKAREIVDRALIKEDLVETPEPRPGKRPARYVMRAPEKD